MVRSSTVLYTYRGTTSYLIKDPRNGWNRFWDLFLWGIMEAARLFYRMYCAYVALPHRLFISYVLLKLISSPDTGLLCKRSLFHDFPVPLMTTKCVILLIKLYNPLHLYP
jgi:hypothetical protein